MTGTLKRKINKKNHPIIFVDIKNRDGPKPSPLASFSVSGFKQKQHFLNIDKFKVPISSQSPKDTFLISTFPSFSTLVSLVG